MSQRLIPLKLVFSKLVLLKLVLSTIIFPKLIFSTPVFSETDNHEGDLLEAEFPTLISPTPALHFNGFCILKPYILTGLLSERARFVECVFPNTLIFDIACSRTG